MPIQIGGKVNVNAPRERVWQEIFDVETMKNVIGRVPGITLERLEQVSDTLYEISAIVGVAAIKGKYDGKITILDRTPPSFVRIKGEGKGAGNWTSGEVMLNLDEADGHTEMSYKGQGNLNGPLASLGQRLVDTVGRQFIDQGAKILANEIEQRVALTTPEAVPMHAVTEEEESYGFVFQAFLTLVVLGSVAALVIALVIESAPH